LCTSCRSISACLEGRGCTLRSSFSACREGRGCTPRSCLSVCRGGIACTSCNCYSACRADRGCTARRCLAACREGRGCSPHTSFSASRAGRGCTPRSYLSACRASIAFVLYASFVPHQPRAPRCAVVPAKSGDVVFKVLGRAEVAAFAKIWFLAGESTRALRFRSTTPIRQTGPRLPSVP
jgi:hypothetical protein